MNKEENKVVESVEETPQQVEQPTPEVDDGVIRVDLRKFKQEQEDAVQ